MNEIILLPIRNKTCSAFKWIASTNNKQPYFYPNPATNSLTFANIKKNTSLKLYDLFGNIVLEKEVENNATIDISQLSKGIYIVVTESDIEKTFNKVIIAK